VVRPRDRGPEPKLDLTSEILTEAPIELAETAGLLPAEIRCLVRAAERRVESG
jgi:hypothetical protein